MMNKKLFFAFCFIVFSIPGYSQNKDFGVWYGGSISHEVFKNMEIDLGICVRTDQNASHINQFYSNLGVGYKFNKYLSISGNYRWILKDEGYKEYFNRYRFYTDFKLTYPVHNFKLSSRFRLQSQYKQYAEKPEDKLPDYYGRVKVQIYYNWPFFPIDPFISAEWFYPLNSYSIKYADQKRLAAGIEYKINKNHAIESEFLFQREYLPRFNDMGIISVTYKFDF